MKVSTVGSRGLVQEFRDIEPDLFDHMAMVTWDGRRRRIPNLTAEDLEGLAKSHRKDAERQAWWQQHGGLMEEPYSPESWQWFEHEGRRRWHLHVADGCEALATKMRSLDRDALSKALLCPTPPPADPAAERPGPRQTEIAAATPTAEADPELN